MSDTFPRTFGRYTLLEPLAQGGMGSLYLAFVGEVGMEKLCVVKTVLKELADKEYIARFRDEAKVVVRLSHGNLVPVFDAGTVDGELYIAMEYVDGKDLRAVWNRCAAKGIAFPIDVAAYIIKELCRGLHHAHHTGDLKLVHRDVSPPNLLLAYSGEVKLTDFGLAASTLKLERTAPGVIYGKVSYMSPEQARGDALDGRADLYAAGIILWELLTGRQLFPNAEGDALERVRHPNVVRPSLRAGRVPPALDSVVMKGLHVEPAERYADGEAMRVALAEWLAREAPTVDTSKVAAFLRELFGEEIETERRRREALVGDSHKTISENADTRVARVQAVAAPAQSAARARSRPLVSLGKDDDDGPTGIYDGDGDSDRSARVVGTILDGRYRVSRLIGEGGMGRVYEGEHIDIGKRVAIKVLHPVYSRFPEVVARFRREARAASKIGHPNIVDVTDSGTTQTGAVYFVMEYLEGSDLADIIAREQALAVDRAIHIGIQLARALEAAHAANVIHRDLKPENIFLVARPGQTDFVKVLDFGIARNLELDVGNQRLTRPNMAMGTPEYMAPEQAAGRPADARADIYALGAILFEMLTGAAPHKGDNSMEVLNKKATETPPPVASLRPDVNAQLSETIVRALSRSAGDRQQSMAELAVDLERCRPERRRSSSSSESRAVVSPVSASLSPAPIVLALDNSRGTSTARKLPMVPLALGVGGTALLIVGVASMVARGGAVTDNTRETQSLRAMAASASREPGAPPRVSPLPEPSEHPTRVAAPVAPVGPAVATAEHTHSPAAPRTEKTAGPSAVDYKKTIDDANHLLRDHQFREAERAFQKCVDGNFERGVATTGLARVAFETGRYDEAVKQGERAVRANGGIAAHMVLGDAWYKTQKYERAIKEFQAVLHIKPDHGEARRHLDAARQRAASGG